LTLKAFFSRPMNRRKAPLQKPRVFLSVGRVRATEKEEVIDMVRDMLAWMLVWVEGAREEIEGLLRGCWRGVWFVWAGYWD
jgi:hypothetical protein